MLEEHVLGLAGHKRKIPQDIKESRISAVIATITVYRRMVLPRELQPGILRVGALGIEVFAAVGVLFYGGKDYTVVFGWIQLSCYR
jgi:hypothetical protein